MLLWGQNGKCNYLVSLLKFNPSNSNLTLRAAKHPDAVGLNLPGMALCTWCWEGQAGLGHSPVSFWREREQQIVPNASIIAFLGWRAPAPWGCARKAGRGTEPESELCSRLSKNSCWHAAPAQHCWLRSLGCTPSWASAPYWLWDGSAHHQGLGASLGWLCCSPRASRALCQPGVSDGSCGTSPGGCRSIWAVCKQQPQPPPKKDFFTASQPWCGGGESKTPHRRAVGQTEPHGPQVPCSTSPYGWESLNGCGGQGPCVPLLPNPQHCRLHGPGEEKLSASLRGTWKVSLCSVWLCCSCPKKPSSEGQCLGSQSSGGTGPPEGQSTAEQTEMQLQADQRASEGGVG